jgi:hypothetical protein
VHLQVGLTQAFARPVSQGRHPVRGQPEQRGHLGGLGPFDLGVPEDGLPAFGQRRESARDHASFQPRHRRIGERNARVERLQLIGDELPAHRAVPVVGAPADDGQQVRAERALRAAAAAQQVQDLGEGLGHHVVRLGHVPDELAGQAVRRRHVPLVQGRVRHAVTGPAGRDEIGVARRQRSRGFNGLLRRYRGQVRRRRDRSGGLRGDAQYSPSLRDSG